MDIETTTQPVPGKNVFLSIDIGLQGAVEDILAARIDEINSDPQRDEKDKVPGAAAVVSDVNTGEVLARASWPTYDPATFLANYSDLRNNPNAPLFNRATMGTYAPGSTFKMVTALAGLKTGTITAGNSSGITDAAAAMVLASEKFVKQNNLKPLARILGATSAGVDPCYMGIGPVPAVRKLEGRLGLKLADFDLVELNEAFAAQVLACDRELHFDRDKLNVNGGAIALGHPIGCTGTRITVTLLHELVKRKARRGLATLCVSGGMGMALAIENCL
jgi:acetyl-CoA acetyltransferase